MQHHTQTEVQVGLAALMAMFGVDASACVVEERAGELYLIAAPGAPQSQP